MANGEYGKVFKRVWGDPDFKALTVNQQALYMKLISQPDISLAGVLTLAVPRWTAQTDGLAQSSVEKALDALEAARFVVCDRQTQEVLVRSYIRNDLGWKSTKTFKAIAGAVERVLSTSIRAAISAELLRIDIAQVSDKQGSYEMTPREFVSGCISRLVLENPPLDGVSDTPSDTPSDGVYPSSLLAPAIAIAPAKATATANANANARKAARGPFDEFWANFPSERKANKSGCFEKFFTALQSGTDAEMIVEAAKAYRDDPNREPEFTVNPHRWLNEARWESGPLPPRAGALSRSDQNFIADMQRIQQREAEERFLAIEGGAQ